MLEEIESAEKIRTVFRLSWEPGADREFLSQMNVSPEYEGQLLAFLGERVAQNPTEEFLDRPFRPTAALSERSRYSDGSFPVFYGALALETAEAEVAYRFPKYYAGEPGTARTAYYRGFRCRFQGLEKDLRPKLRDWPNLVHDSDYSLCNRLGAEARDGGLDGPVVPSARHEGTNMPIFTRRSVSGPQPEALVAITYDPDTGTVSVARLNGGDAAAGFVGDG